MIAGGAGLLERLLRWDGSEANILRDLDECGGHSVEKAACDFVESHRHVDGGMPRK